MITLVRSIITADSEGVIKRFSATGRTGETFVNREIMQQYGFTSRPMSGAEGLVLMQGNTVYLIASDDRRYRLRLEEGEVALYTDEGDYIHFQRGRTLKAYSGGTIIAEAESQVNAKAPQILAEATEQVKATAPLIEAEASVEVKATAPQITAEATTQISASAPLIVMTAPSGLAITGNVAIAGNLGVTGTLTTPEVSMTPEGMTINSNVNLNGNLAQDGNQVVDGNVEASGTIMDATGNSNHHSHG